MLRRPVLLAFQHVEDVNHLFAPLLNVIAIDQHKLIDPLAAVKEFCPATRDEPMAGAGIVLDGKAEVPQLLKIIVCRLIELEVPPKMHAVDTRLDDPRPQRNQGPHEPRRQAFPPARCFGPAMRASCDVSI